MKRNTRLTRKVKALQHDGPKRKTPLHRTTQLPPGGPLPPMSAKRRQLSIDRRNFVEDFLRKNPRCMVRWNGGCTGWAVHVHEALTRARGGVIVPTPGKPQLFLATCWWCHAMVHDHPEEAARRGFLLTHGRGRPVDVVIVDDPPPKLPVEKASDFIKATMAQYGLG